ncbi:MAG TPA: hypothetical protein VGD01_02570 [Candidatus Elarobacter sp.]|jgi:uncharacterized membrane protein HdeD (DUF308 family)
MTRFHASWRWIVLVLRGAVAIAAGIAAFAISADAAKLLLAAYFTADGLLALVLAARLRIVPLSRALVAADGVIDLVVAVLLFAYTPGERLLILIVALWAIATGVLEFIAAVFVSRVSWLSWGIALTGIASCAVGILMVDRDDLAEIGLLYFFAVYALIAGVLFLTIGVIFARAIRESRAAAHGDAAPP